MEFKKYDYAIKRLKELQLCCNEQNTIQNVEDTNIVLNIIIKEIKSMENKK